jgi:DNA-binding response OmpR family regulator
VVEDDLPSLELLTAVLRLYDVEVRPLSDSAAAKQLIENTQFDGVFLDLQMPGIDGFELARCVRRSRMNPTVPIVILTGREEASTMKEAFAVGGTFFLQKPMDRQKLRKLFHSVRGAMSDAHRRMVRMSMQVDVTCRIAGQSFIGNSRNISLGGMLIDAGRLLEARIPMQVEFCLPGNPKVIRTGAVVERVDEKRRIGVRFTTLRGSDQQSIRTLLDSE